jgi:hypothetical protein
MDADVSDVAELMRKQIGYASASIQKAELHCLRVAELLSQAVRGSFASKAVIADYAAKVKDEASGQVKRQRSALMLAQLVAGDSSLKTLAREVEAVVTDDSWAWSAALCAADDAAAAAARGEL